MNKLKFLSAVFITVLFLSSCEKSDEVVIDDNETEVVSEISENDLIHEYMWRGMNTFYLWQDQVADLSDTRFTFTSELYDYYSSYNSPADVFGSMLYQFGTVDKYSWVVDDYIALENSFQGTNFANGMEFGLVRYINSSTNVFGYVRYVVPNSDAASNGVSRGMIFNEINGTQITDTNFSTLLSANSYSISLADYNGGAPTTNGTTISLTKTDITENPIHISKVITEGTHKIGYLMYNQFASSFDSALNDVFAQFKSEGITDLVVDLRYNGGGSVNSAIYLSQMITGQFTGQVCVSQSWNSKINPLITAEQREAPFVSSFESDGNTVSINSLQLNDIYFITTGSSASASELVMNSLEPYINVTSIGTTTEGKIFGSITIYDSDDFTRDGSNLNSNHFWAMQPLVAEFVNSNGNNSPNGIEPTIFFPEDFGNLGQLGERSDPLLNSAISLISTATRSFVNTNKNLNLEEIGSSKMDLPTFNNMYIERK